VEKWGLSMLQFTIGASPNSNWRVRVVIHNSQRSLDKARGDDSALAFYRSYSVSRSFKEPECVFGEIHFQQGKHMQAKYVAHEVFHSLMDFARLTKLKIHEVDIDGEEWLACSMEHMVENILWMLKKKRVKVL
jgi:hypothetical protein